MHQLNQWHPNYSVFVKELDDQHKQFIDMLNELYDAYLQNAHKEKLDIIVKQLFEYSSIHFATEEKYFKEFGYEDAESHILEHETFFKEISTMFANYNQNKTLLSLKVINYLQDWLINHILNVDRKYISCFKNAGLK